MLGIDEPYGQVHVLGQQECRPVSGSLQVIKTMFRLTCLNLLTAKLFNLNFHPLEVVSR